MMATPLPVNREARRSAPVLIIDFLIHILAMSDGRRESPPPGWVAVIFRIPRFYKSWSIRFDAGSRNVPYPPKMGATANSGDFRNPCFNKGFKQPGPPCVIRFLGCPRPALVIASMLLSS